MSELYDDGRAPRADAGMLRALYLVRRCGLAFEMRGETLIARPADAARQHADEITRHKPEIVRLVTRGVDRPLAEALCVASNMYGAAVLEGFVVEAIEHAQAGRPGLWDHVTAALDAVDEAARTEQWDAFQEALCDLVESYYAVRESYLALAGGVAA